MSEKFTASNGVTIDYDGQFLFTCGARLGLDDVDALREFFLHERDQELGRWRDPENPDRYVRHGYVGPRAGRGERRWLTIVDERTELSYSVAEDYDSAGMGDLWETAKRYFAAHPARKPWHDAKHGEVWVLKYRELEHAVLSDGRYFVWPEGSQSRRDSELITAGRKIWPVES